MPILTPGATKQPGVINGNAEPQGQRTKMHFEQHRGIPRREDFVSLRMLERSHPIALPMGTIKTQVSTTDWTFRPTVEDPTEEHLEACEEEEEFLKGRYNANGEPSDHLFKNWVHDIISIDTGVVEKVPNEDGFLSELYNRDGAVFTKNLDKHGRLPDPIDDEDPAYWQYSFQGSVTPWDPNRSLSEMAEEYAGGMYGSNVRDPIGFTREQLVWTETNPAPWRNYGFGKVQQAKRVAEIVLNQDTSNLSYFSKNEVPDGVVNVVEANQDEISEFREYWREEVKGRDHVLPIVGGAGSDIDWIPFRPTPDELEFMQSQKWYNQLIWMIFGLNQGEVGDIENINRATMKEQATNIFRTTTKPLLDRLSNDYNRHILPYRENYQRVNGEIEFTWIIDNPAMKERERQQQKEDLEVGVRTINEIRQERGEEPLQWGDMPLELMRSVSRSNPGWALEQWADVENPPEQLPTGLMSAYGGSSASQTNNDDDSDGDGEEAGSGNPNRSGEARIDYREILGSGEIELCDGTSKSLRDDDWNWQYAPLAGVAEDLSERVGSVIRSYEDDLVSMAEDAFPEEDDPEQPVRPPIDGELEEFSSNLARDLQPVVVESDLEAMQTSADYHAAELEEEAEKRFSQKADADEISLLLDLDVTDTLAAEHLSEQAAFRMVTVGETIKDEINNLLTNVAEDGGSVTEATEVLRDKVDQLSDSHARLVGRTEILDAGRWGSQGLAEASDLIAGKQWNSSGDPDDGRTRSWHAEMNDTIVPKDQSFVVPSVNDPDQPADYPRETFVVGGDQPFNCRCDQRSILREDMPEDLQSLNAIDGVTAWRIPKDSERMREIMKENAEPGDSLADVLRRALDGNGVTKACEELGISTATIYGWGEAAGIEEFSRS